MTKIKTQSLKKRKSQLAETERQLESAIAEFNRQRDAGAAGSREAVAVGG